MRIPVLILIGSAALTGCPGSEEPGCEDDLECTGRRSCEGGMCVCVAGATGAQCATNADCLPGQECEADCTCSGTPIDAGDVDGGTDVGADASVACTEVTETTDPNDTDAQAQDLGELTSGAAFCFSGACTDSDVDFVQLTTTATGELVGEAVSCENPTDLTAIELFDADSTFLGGPIDEMCDARTVVVDAVAGVYFARIACDPGASGTYTVRLALN